MKINVTLATLLALVVGLAMAVPTKDKTCEFTDCQYRPICSNHIVEEGTPCRQFGIDGFYVREKAPDSDSCYCELEQHIIQTISNSDVEPVQPINPDLEPGEPIYPDVKPVQPIYPDVKPVQPIYPDVKPVQPIYPDVKPVQPIYPDVKPVQPIYPDVEPVQPIYPDVEPVQPIDPDVKATFPMVKLLPLDTGGPKPPMTPMTRSQAEGLNTCYNACDGDWVQPLPSPCTPGWLPVGTPCASEEGIGTYARSIIDHSCICVFGITDYY
ncbi:hypothetical protein NDN08_005731 [Rhodosorus marinus]|uniref:Uncharacterized protein n=1 Tax=Rhodosorus marinus TaxID=101924 RepID=A0AAV8V2F5_9RHOD|nr:hypothetical protein NDN08_005731 [Rhodosorus marinus]